LSGLLDIDLARRIATAGTGDEDPAMSRGADLASAGARAADAVLSYTGLQIAEPLPEPEWIRSRTQPIGIRDVVAYLRDAPNVPEAAGREIQIGGPDVMRHLDVIARFSKESGRRPAIRVPLPDRIASPGVVAAGAATVTSGSPAVAAELSHGLADDTTVTDPSGGALFDIRPEPLNVAIQRALIEQEGERDG